MKWIKLERSLLGGGSIPCAYVNEKHSFIIRYADNLYWFNGVPYTSFRRAEKAAKRYRDELQPSS